MGEYIIKNNATVRAPREVSYIKSTVHKDVSDRL